MKRVQYLLEMQKLTITGIIFLVGGLATLFITLNNVRGALMLLVGIILLIGLILLNKDIGKDISKRLED